LTGGAFQTSREIFDNEIWQNVVEFRLFFLIYGMAIFADGVKKGGVEVKRGQWLRSIRNLQSDLEYKENRSIKKYSTSTIDRAIKNLIKSERIKVETTELGTLFEVVNYAKYQEFDNYKSCIENAERTIGEQQQNSSETVAKQIENNNKNVEECKEVIYIPYSKIIDYLNLKTGTSYKHTSAKTQTLIKARWNEKFTEKDFFTVINNKANSWLNDTAMNKFLRPETLFGTKFESYLNETAKPIVKPPTDHYRKVD